MAMRTALPAMIAILGAGAAAHAQSAIPTRTPLAVLPVGPAKTVSRVETTQVDFAPAR